MGQSILSCATEKQAFTICKAKKDYEEKRNTGFQQSDRIPTDNEYRRLKEGSDFKTVCFGCS